MEVIFARSIILLNSESVYFSIGKPSGKRDFLFYSSS